MDEFLKEKIKELLEIMKNYENNTVLSNRDDIIQDIMKELIEDINNHININQKDYLEIKFQKVLNKYYKEIYIKNYVKESLNTKTKIEEYNPEEIAMKHSMQEELINIIEKSNLTRKELEILLTEYPIYDNIEISEEMIKKRYNLYPKKIEEIKLKALHKLIMEPDMINLTVYMDHPKKALSKIRKSKYEAFIKRGESLDKARKTRIRKKLIREI